MNPHPTDAEKVRQLPWLYAYDAFIVLFCGLTVFGSVFTLFLNELGLDKSQIGFLLALTPLCGVIAPFVAPYSARYGYRRLAVLFYTLRKFIIMALLLTPWVAGRFGLETTFWFVSAVILAFGVFRAIAETSIYPWLQEVVPQGIRGKVTAVEFIMVTLGSIAALLLGGGLVRGGGLTGYLWLIGAGCAAGFAGVFCLWHFPGGQPAEHERAERSHLRKMASTLRDRDFRLFMLGVGLAMFGTLPVGAFLPLFLTERAGLTPSAVLLTQIGSFVAALIFSYFWGWASDRYGSKPVMMTGLVILSAMNLTWLALPHESAMPLVVAIFFLTGAGSMAYSISSSRQLFISVPFEKKNLYMPVYYTAISLFLALPPLLAGVSLDALKRVSRLPGWSHLDPYMPLFVVSAALCLLGLAPFRAIRSRGDLPARHFASLFLRGNPITALGIIARFSWAAGEEQRISLVERMGDAKSPLAASELIEALGDPSFNVRYEAINSIARTPSRDDLLEALIHILRHGELELRAASAWALSRLDDRAALPALRETLESPYPLLRSRAARALGMLNDYESAEKLRVLLRGEGDFAFKIAFATALGNLADAPSAADIFDLLQAAESDTARGELALALSRIVGDGGRFARQWRKMRSAFSAAAGAAILDLKKALVRSARDRRRAVGLVDQAVRDFSAGDLSGGTKQLVELIHLLPMEKFYAPARMLLDRLSDETARRSDPRKDYLALILHILHSVLED